MRKMGDEWVQAATGGKSFSELAISDKLNVLFVYVTEVDKELAAVRKEVGI